MDQKTIKIKTYVKIIVTEDTSLEEIVDEILFVKLKDAEEDTIVVLQKGNLICPKCESDVKPCGSQIGGKHMYRCKNDGCGYRFTPSETIPKMRHSLKEVVKGLKYHKKDEISLRKVSDCLRNEDVFISYNGVWKWEKITINILNALIDTFEFQITKEENEIKRIKDGDIKFLVKNKKFLAMHNKLINYLTQQRILTWEQLEENIGTSKSTLWRILQNTKLTTSLNFNRKYVALKETVEKNADENGICQINNAVFSTSDSLRSTTVNIIEKSDNGRDVAELERYLNTSPKQTVVDLYREEKIKYVKVGHRHIYISPTKGEEQIKARIKTEPKGGIKLNTNDVKKASLNVGKILKKTIKEAMEYVGIEDKDMSRADILIASVIKPLIHINSDRDLARHLENNPTREGFYDFTEPPGHSTISEVKKEFGRVGYDFVFRNIAMNILKKLNIKELIIAIDTTHAFKSQNKKWGLKYILQECIRLAYQ